MTMRVITTKGDIDVEFDEPPKIENRRDALKILDLLIKADYMKEPRFALKTIKEAIKKGLV
jgi:hypothetical protein